MKKPWERFGLPKPKSEASGGPLSLRDYEIYSGVEVPEGLIYFVRLDGWKFHKYARKLNFDKPYDRFFASCLVKATKPIFELFDPLLCYIFSDEANFLFTKTPGFTRVEKIDSVFAGLFSTTFTSLMKKKYKKCPNLIFDCRCIPMEKEKIVDYLTWRQAEALRNHNNSWAYYLLRERGESARSATKRLKGLGTAELYKLCRECGVDLDKTPTWQRHGILVYKEIYLKKGFDPIRRKSVTVKRKRVVENWDIPRFDKKEGKDFLEEIITTLK